MPDRRSILKTALGASALSVWDSPLSFALASLSTERRFVVIILRGALDGLAVVPPIGDPDYRTVRGVLALDAGIGVHDLDGHFALNPSFATLKSMWDAKELAVFHNIATPYRDRSHFDGQNVLETGGAGPHAFSDGWLNRALKPMRLEDGGAAVAIATSPPLMLAGQQKVSSWMPDKLPMPDAQFLERLRALYGSDPVLASSFDRALAMEAEAEQAMDDKQNGSQPAPNKGGGYGDIAPLFSGAGRLLARDDGPRVAVLDVGGWDTHVGEGASDGQLARRLSALDAAIDSMRTALGAAWQKTAIVMATEFGRTVAPNGNGGTDHGTASAAFLFGGAVRGGAVHAEWVGLRPSVLKDGRDQPPRTDIRSLFKGALGDHMRVSRRELETSVFPDSAHIAPAANLIGA